MDSESACSARPAGSEPALAARGSPVSSGSGSQLPVYASRRIRAERR
jgi:hypothetical protein